MPDDGSDSSAGGACAIDRGLNPIGSIAIFVLMVIATRGRRKRADASAST